MRLARFILLACIGLSPGMNDALARHQMVLVVPSDSPLVELDSLQLRKIFLGFNVKHDGKMIRGLRNATDDGLDEVFLQTVVAMSDAAYTRRQISLSLRQGVPRVREYRDLEKLLQALSANPYSVTFMWKEDAQRTPDVRILRMLWGRE